MVTRPSPGSTGPRRRSARHALTSLIAATGLLLPLVALAAPASAAEQPAGEGWARLAHLSPDTKSVDVVLTAAAGGQTLFELEDVAYGDVSDYVRLPVGTFLVEMTPADAAEDAAPAVSEVITVEKDQPITLAVMGPNSDLVTKVLDDDLTPPADGQARVRVVQASTVADTVDITTTTGDVIAAGAAKGQVTGYATVDDGPWDLELSSGSISSTASIELASGSVNTLLVLDNASGGLTIKPISDSEAVKETPVGGTNTGAAPASATTASTLDDVAPGMGIALVGAVMLLLGAAARRSRPATVRAGRI
jgi:hypothetical protein